MKVQIFQLLTARMKINQILYVIFQSHESAFFNPNLGEFFRGSFWIGEGGITPVSKTRYNYGRNLKFGT